MARTGGSAFRTIGRGLLSISAREQAEALEREREEQRQKERGEDVARQQQQWETNLLMTPGVRRAPDTETGEILQPPDFGTIETPDPFAPSEGIGVRMPTDLPPLEVPDSLKPGTPAMVTTPYELEQGEQRIAPGLAYDPFHAEKQAERDRDRTLTDLRGVYGDTPEGERRARAAALGVTGRLDAPMTGEDEMAELEERLRMQLRYSPRQIDSSRGHATQRWTDRDGKVYDLSSGRAVPIMGPDGNQIIERVKSDPALVRAAEQLLAAVAALDYTTQEWESGFADRDPRVGRLVQASPFRTIEEARRLAREGLGLPELPPPSSAPENPALESDEDRPGWFSRMWGSIRGAGSRDDEPDMSDPAVRRAAFLRGRGYSDEEILEDARRRERMGIR